MYVIRRGMALNFRLFLMPVGECMLDVMIDWRDYATHHEEHQQQSSSTISSIHRRREHSILFTKIWHCTSWS